MSYLPLKLNEDAFAFNYPVLTHQDGVWERRNYTVLFLLEIMYSRENKFLRSAS